MPAVWKQDDRVEETSVTTGVGDYTLDGATAGHIAWSTMGANNIAPFYSTDDTNFEVGIGTILTAPNRLQRTQILKSSNGGAAVNWGAGTRKIRCGLPSDFSTRKPLESRTANTILAQADFGKTIVVTGASTFSQTFTAAATLADGWRVKYKNAGTGVVTLDPNAAETINGAATIALQPGQGCEIWCDGTAFYAVVANSAEGPAKFAGNVTLGDSAADSHLVNGQLSIVDDSSAGLVVQRSGSGDAILIGGQAAGSGSIIQSYNGAQSDFEPLNVIAEFVAFNIRTGVGTSAEKARLDTSGNFMVGKAAVDGTSAGFETRVGASLGATFVIADAQPVLYLDRLTDDGVIVNLSQANTLEGTISVSGTTVSYNGGHLGRFAQMLAGDPPPRGTVLASAGIMCEWFADEWIGSKGAKHHELYAGTLAEGQTYTTQERREVLPERDSKILGEDGKPRRLPAVFEAVEIVHTIVREDNEQLIKVKVSEVAGDRTIYGIMDFIDKDGEPMIACVGDFVIRVTGSVNNGDLLESAGDGTARAQADQSQRTAWTIAKAVIDDARTEDRLIPCLLLIG